MFGTSSSGKVIRVWVNHILIRAINSDIDFFSNAPYFQNFPKGFLINMHVYLRLQE